MNKKLIAAIFIAINFLSFFFEPYFAQQRDFFSVPNRIKFANNLYANGDYIRAFDEYVAVLPQTTNDTLRLWAGICLRNLQRYNEAEDYFKGLFFFSNLEPEARAEFYRTKFIRKDYAYFFNSKNPLEKFPEKYNRELLKLKYFSLFYLPNATLPDSAKLLNIYDFDEAETIAEFYHKRKTLEKKDPTTAAVLSVIIPGAGKIYTENYSDGITAFLASELFYGLAAYKFSDDKNLAGALFAGIGLFFHAGSVYGSAASAQIFNEQKEAEFENALSDYAQKENYFLPSFEPGGFGKRGK